MAEFVASLMSGVRVFRGSRSKMVYSFLGRHFRDETDWRFMNYGYAFDDGADAPDLHPDDEAERYGAQLYHVVASQTDLVGKRLLEIGSGRGGGASHVHRYLNPHRTIAIDLADSAVAFCQKVHGHIPGLEFRVGDAMDLPFQAEEFDVVMNVESSHCYPDRQAFFDNVFSVLKPGGSFVYTDFNAPEDRAEDDLKAAGFDRLTVTDITPNVIQGLQHDHARRDREISTRFPFGTRRIARLWAGTEGSWIFRDFCSGVREYMMYRADKPA